MHRRRTLRSRVFSWFVGAILLAVMTSALVVSLTRPEATSGVEAAAHHMSTRLARDWDDPAATDAFVEEVRDVTGFDVRLLRGPLGLPPQVKHVAERGGVLAPAAADRILVPIARDGTVLGALEMNRFGVRPALWSFWRVGLALFAVFCVLSVMASRIANLLSRPLELLAGAADRFGSGDLAYRADLGRAPGWVALEVRHVAVSFNRMAERVEAMVRGQRELLGAISHELRSPLGRARVALEIARERLPGTVLGEAPPLQHGEQGQALFAPAAWSAAPALDDVETQLTSIDRILGELLDLTRAGLADLRRQTLGVVDWLRARIREEPGPPAILLEAEAQTLDVAAPFDPALLARAVHNLLVNAQAHGHPSEQPLVVLVSRRGDALRVIVRDRGAGFPEGFSDRAFEPFVRGDPARSRPAAGAGYGLGLAIVRRIVEAHGGVVFARNARRPPGKAGPGAGEGGAEVGFDLPTSMRPRSVG